MNKRIERARRRVEKRIRRRKEVKIKIKTPKTLKKSL